MQVRSEADAGVVFAGAMSHAPHIVAFADRAPREQRDNFYAAAHVLGERLRQAAPDALALVSSDHFSNFGFEVMPTLALGRATTYRGPFEDWLGIPKRVVQGACDHASQIARELMLAMFDVSICDELTLEHGLMVPLQFLDPKGSIPLIPIIQNCLLPPLPRLERCYALGEALDAAARACGLRLAVVGAGGLSHAPGAETSPFIDEDFDAQFLRRLELGIGEDQPSDVFSADRIDSAGFGTWEIRQWMTAWGAAGGCRASVLAYEPIPAWETGCAVAEFDI